MADGVAVSKRAAAQLRAGYPWVYPQDLGRANTTADIVQVLDHKREIIGAALFSPDARLPLRMLGRDPLALDCVSGGSSAFAALLRERMAAALARRTALFADADAYRVVHAEADRLPGLILDRYADVAVVQTLARAMDAREAEIAKVAAELLGVRLVVARDDGSSRDFEGLARRRDVLFGDGEPIVRYHESGNELEIDVLADGKTGGFLDQRENHERARRYAFGDALDAFTYHGGFALALARGGARSVMAIDEAPAAVERARRNAERNGLSQVSVAQGNAFDVLRTLEGEGRTFDVVVIDPPAFAKRKSALLGAERAYKELNLRGLRLLRKDGILISCSCSGKLTPEHFGEILAGAAADVGRSVQILERCGPGRDHPPLMNLPETDYLKCFILRVIE